MSLRNTVTLQLHRNVVTCIQTQRFAPSTAFRSLHRVRCRLLHQSSSESVSGFQKHPSFRSQSSRRISPALAVILGGVAAWSFLDTNRDTKTSLDSPISYIRDLLPFRRGDVTGWRGSVYPALTLDQANIKLRSEETATTLPARGGSEVHQFYTSRLQSNHPTEDTFSYESIDVGAPSDWQVWGVYDGHAGWATSRLLADQLTRHVAKSLKQDRNVAKSFAPEAVDLAIKSSFLRFDDEIMSDGVKALTNAKSHAEALSRIAPARAGSCALLAIFDPLQSLLRVACVGDSRAVLGRLSESNSQTEGNNLPSWTAEALSKDQTGFNESERKLVEGQHPGETEIFDLKTGRLLGIAVTRAFGDHRFKWSKDDIVKCEKEYFGTAPRPKYESPPYMTAEPVITTTDVKEGDFVILASDGYWDHVSNEDAVECVAKWMRETRQPNAGKSTSASSVGSDLQRGYSADFKSTPEYFVTEDDNVATHLIRNALGGSRRDLFCSVMSSQAPESRMVRDDITVQVIFFGKSLAV